MILPLSVFRERLATCYVFFEDVVDGDQPGPVVYDRGNVVGACADCAAMFIRSLLHPEEGIQDGDEQRAAEWAARQNARFNVEPVVPLAIALCFRGYVLVHAQESVLEATWNPAPLYCVFEPSLGDAREGGAHVEKGDEG